MAQQYDLILPESVPADKADKIFQIVGDSAFLERFRDGYTLRVIYNRKEDLLNLLQALKVEGYTIREVY